jgi:peptide deformylase
MNQILDLINQEHPLLRQQAQAIHNIKDPSLEKLVTALLTTLKFYQGVGIAAPQVGQSLRLFIVASYPNQRYPFAVKMTPTPMINPKIINHNHEQVKGWEGCLTVPNVRGLVPRYSKIEVEYFDLEGNLQRRYFQDFIARIFQHELDHLDGILFIDRLENPQDRFTEAQYQELIHQSTLSPTI